MRNQLSAHIILACLITILTASGSITKNVYAAGEDSRNDEFAIVVVDTDTGVEVTCPSPLLQPIVVTLFPDAKSRSGQPQTARWSVTQLSLADQAGDIIVQSSDFFSWIDRFGGDERRRTPLDLVVDPGANQLTKLYIIGGIALRGGKSINYLRIVFSSLANGDECVYATKGAERLKLVADIVPAELE